MIITVATLVLVASSRIVMKTATTTDRTSQKPRARCRADRRVMALAVVAVCRALSPAFAWPRLLDSGASSAPSALNSQSAVHNRQMLAGASSLGAERTAHIRHAVVPPAGPLARLAAAPFQVQLGTGAVILGAILLLRRIFKKTDPEPLKVDTSGAVVVETVKEEPEKKAEVEKEETGPAPEETKAGEPEPKESKSKIRSVSVQEQEPAEQAKPKEQQGGWEAPAFILWLGLCAVNSAFFAISAGVAALTVASNMKMLPEGRSEPTEKTDKK